MEREPINNAIYFCFCRNDAFVDPTPEIQKELKAELERVAKVSMIRWKNIAPVISNCSYGIFHRFQQLGGGGGVDMSKFPDFKFEEPKLDPINMETK